ncbi:MAG: 16S rRNA (guanine(966)-N(2))-methyltransferase RsmD [Anaerolineae bacterium]
MPIRVIAGSARGRQLKLVPGDSTRPIMDRVKESLFNIIGQDILDALFLDLFSGTGSVGIEALSRGAAKAYFIDSEKIAIQTIDANLKLTRLAERAVVRRGDAFAFLSQTPPEHFDYIYIAPPQYKAMWLRTLEVLEANPVWIPEGTIVIVQIDPTELQPANTRRLVEYDRRKYGNTLLIFYEASSDLQDERLQP